jgi:hypothetical protein
VKRIASVLLILVVCLAGFLIIRNRLQTEETKVRKVLSFVERAIERKNIPVCLLHISSGYSDDFGNSHGMLTYLLRQVFGMYRSIDVGIRDLRIDVNADSATASFVGSAVATVSKGGEKENLTGYLGTDGFIVTFNKEDGKWRIKRVGKIEYTFE